MRPKANEMVVLLKLQWAVFKAPPSVIKPSKMGLTDFKVQISGNVSNAFR
jgi:hypothetical protein